MEKKRIELFTGEINYTIDLLRDYGQEIYESDFLDYKDLFAEIDFINNLIKKLEGSK